MGGVVKTSKGNRLKDAAAVMRKTLCFAGKNDLNTASDLVGLKIILSASLVDDKHIAKVLGTSL